MNTDKWTVSKARTVFAQLTKIANEQLEVAAAPEDVESAGSAGPQEVVDALEVIVSELEQVQEAIPAEPSVGEEPSVEAPVDEPVSEEPVEEEEPKLAKQVRELTAQLEKVELEKVAQQYGDLFEDYSTKQAKYEEVLASNEKPSFWVAKIEAIEQYKQNEGASSYKPAKTQSSWIQPRTKVAKQAGEGMMSL